MSEGDVQVTLRRIYGAPFDLHYDLFEQSNAHREAHGEDCHVYPSSPTTGPLWPLLTAMTGARRFLEVGCGLGYTAALMAEAGGTGCTVDTIESVAEHAELAELELSRRGLSDRVRVIRGGALGVLPRLPGPYDIVFVDAGWNDYPRFLPHLRRLVRTGGVLVTANLFPLFEEWAREMAGRDAIEEYLARLIREPGFRTYVVPGAWKAISYRLPTG